MYKRFAIVAETLCAARSILPRPRNSAKLPGILPWSAWGFSGAGAAPGASRGGGSGFGVARASLGPGPEPPGAARVISPGGPRPPALGSAARVPPWLKCVHLPRPGSDAADKAEGKVIW